MYCVYVPFNDFKLVYQNLVIWLIQNISICTSLNVWVVFSLSYYTEFLGDTTVDIMNKTTVNSLLEGVDMTKYYRYEGSLTTPSCNEIVIWTVFKDKIKINQESVSLSIEKRLLWLTPNPNLNLNPKISAWSSFVLLST